MLRDSTIAGRCLRSYVQRVSQQDSKTNNGGFDCHRGQAKFSSCPVWTCSKSGTKISALRSRYHFFTQNFSQVIVWQERLDRTCCERLKAIQSPPTMVGMVMLMAMVLLGKHEFSPFPSGTAGTTRHDRKSIDGITVADDTSSSGGHSKKRNRLEPSQPRQQPQPAHAGTEN